MPHSLRVLLIEDSQDDADLIIRHILSGGYTPLVERVETAEQMRAALAHGVWDCIIADYSLPQFGALQALAIVQEQRIDAPFIVVSGTIGEERAAQIVKAGAHNYVAKDNLANLIGVLSHEVTEAQYRAPRRAAEARADALLSATIAAWDQTLEGWARALELRDDDTEGHSQRVTRMAVRLARLMGLRNGALDQIRRGALLHDIGKMGIPDSILLKHGPLTPAERRIMQRHPVLAYELLSPIAYLHEASDIPYCHHEKWDGTGYPRGLKGDAIPLAARIFSVCDVWDALRSKRPYRRAWGVKRTLKEIRSLAGTSFDPAVVDVFCPAIEDGTL